MILNLFRKKNALFFNTDDWKINEKNGNYYLKFYLRKIKLTPSTKVYIYKRQGDRYIFMSEGFKHLDGNELLYYAHLPFSGIVRVK